MTEGELLKEYGNVVWVGISNIATAYFTFLFTKKKSDADAAKSLAEAYQHLVSDLRDEIKELKEKVGEYGLKLLEQENFNKMQADEIVKLKKKEQTLQQRINQLEEKGK